MQKTVTLLVSFLPATEAVIVAVPAAFAVTLPLLDTEATEDLLEDQETLLFVPVIDKTLVLPVSSVIDVLLIRIVAACAIAELVMNNRINRATKLSRKRY